MTLTLRPLTTNDSEAIETVRQYLRHYVTELDIDLSGQDFEQEMAALPGAYAMPEGRLLLAEIEGRPAGCIGVRRISEGSCEMTRLYVAPAERGHGIARALVLAAIQAAKEIGYKQLLLSILPNMRMAAKLFRELGFYEAPAYCPTPVEDTVFLALDLDNWTDEKIRNGNLSRLFGYNRAWARQMREADPDYFDKLARLQTPEFLWIGCSDSRVPANQIVGLLPGEVFVHRNVANVVVHTDLNCLSVIQYAVDVLKVKHIMVVGHYGCGGVGAALNRDRVGIVDLWLRHVHDVHNKHLAAVDNLPPEKRHDRLCELNVLEQVVNVCHNTVVQDAWQRGQQLTVHGWIYGLKDGHVHNLGITVDSLADLPARYDAALKALED